ncbi:hypothetical protein ACE1TI_18845 [Alteribacillus sp. JSM 102045]|uniref:hypothetical protein n=1 Tax=Alteribacillus sp. JSM 102045 TaxID=1562101 RepID=UPI0035C01AD0
MINSVSPYQLISYTKNTYIKTDSYATNTFSISQATENIQEAKIQQTNSSNTWEELSSKYDVRKATFEEIKEIAKTLYDAGEISLKEHLGLTFDYEKATNYLKQNAPIPISPNFDMYETVSNRNGKRDWITEFEARANKDLKYGNLIGHQNKMNIFTILQRLDT